jgi:Response regulators consisting of a CheY-like receiver domain and a winged-helix DNA-binding domain
MVSILVVEDDRHLNNIICSCLNDSGYKAVGCLNANDAYDTMYNSLFDLIISDIMMPDIDGFQFAETVRGVNKTIPIMFITARDDMESMKKGYLTGIDDYMVKPLKMGELVLRIGALLRRANIANSKRIEVGSFVMDADAITATIKRIDVPITVREFNILYKLLSYPNHTFSRSQLMDEFWGLDSDTSLRSVDVYINKLREKFSSCEDFKIVTIHGLGYKAVLK